MEKVAFIGGYDKTDLILAIARILSIMQHKVLFIDQYHKKLDISSLLCAQGLNILQHFKI